MGRSRVSRYSRVPATEDESEFHAALSDANLTDVEEGRVDIHGDYDSGSRDVGLRSPSCSSHPSTSSDGISCTNSKWTRRKRLLSWKLLCRQPRGSVLLQKKDCTRCGKSRRPLRLIIRSLAVALMLLGLIEFFVLAVGFIDSLFPEDFESAHAIWRPSRPQDPTSHWATDYTADIQPVQCHSHNDYWRPIPLKSAVEAGCTGVEADVWFLPDRSTDELFVGHSRSSLTTERTFRSLYIDPLVDILEMQNPITAFHPELDSPRNGVFDTDPAQTLVLLVDFKTDGQELWSYVSEQLEPLRQKQYLTHFNGTSVIEGPITVVATGNAPFNKVVENSHHRDIFFDAPLDLLADLAPSQAGEDPSTSSVFEDLEEKAYLEEISADAPSSVTGSSNQGQGYSGAAPKNAAVYSAANSYYASVSFGSSIGHALPFLRRAQKQKIRQQIKGAHKQGLKVRYWDTPSWPVGLRNYIWRVLVEEGVDYLNVDDLIGATKGDWGRPRRRHPWSLSDWSLWGRK